MTIRILEETIVLHGFSFLQGLYFATRMIERALVLALLGIVAWKSRVSALRQDADASRQLTTLG